MRNVTLSIEDDVLKAGREYAKKHSVSFNSFVRRLIKQASSAHENWIDEFFGLMDKAKLNSRGKKWERKELYRV